MIKIDQNNPFNALWNNGNAQLNPNRDGILWELARKVKNIVFYIPNSVIAACINPRKESRFKPSIKLQANHGDFTKEIITPDQVHLTAHIHVKEEAAVNTPTVIMFNPLGANDGVHSKLKDELSKRNCNVVTFDYRGYGSTRRAEDLVVDGESVYQYVTKELGIQSDKVHFYGYSLGGAIAAQVKALHPESAGKYVGDRPFRSVFSLITEKCCIEKLGCLIKKITSFISAIFIAYPVYLLGWEWDGSKALTQLKGDKRVVYHPNDWLIPCKASLASLCPADKRVSLNPKRIGPSTHFAPIGAQTMADGTPAVNAVVDFLTNNPS